MTLKINWHIDKVDAVIENLYIEIRESDNGWVWIINNSIGVRICENDIYLCSLFEAKDDVTMVIEDILTCRQKEFRA